MKRLLIVLLVLSMLLPYAVFAERAEHSQRITAAQYAEVDAMWQKLLRAEKSVVADAQSAREVAAAVEKNELYVPDTLRWNGEDHFTFETTTGVTCGYSARLRNIAKKAEASVLSQPERETICYSEQNTASAYDVYVIEPYLGIDESFTDQYQKEGKSIAAAMNGTYHLYTRNEATIDAVADAMENGAVVIFDSHGDTDFARGDDYTSGATTSYLLLQTGAGLTTDDYKMDANGVYHAVNYGSASGGMKLYAVDGTCIANHMEKEANHGLVWMAICLSMATDGLQAPLRAKGMEVVYGYSQSVTFDYDYMWEEVFFDELIDGKDVATAVQKMKNEVGLWDCCDYYENIREARNYDAAFPIVVSSEDAYPGHGNVDDLQTVYSTWVLPKNNECTHQNVEENYKEASCLEGGYRIVTCLDCGEEIVNEVYEMLWHSFEMSKLDPTCDFAGGDFYTCVRCGDFYVENEIPAIGHNYVDEICVNCGRFCPCYDFSDVTVNDWFHDAVLFAYGNAMMNGVGDRRFAPNAAVTRAMLVTILHRTEASESIDEFVNPFTDVVPGTWYHDAVVWAASKGIVNGIDAVTFAPEAPLTREQIAAILYRHAGSPEVTDAKLEFPDAAEISLYALDAMRWAVEAGLINGMDGKLAPTGTATRAQIAAILMRYMSK